MSEWARGGLDNINSVLPGFARNPYNTAYATGGSSGGTGAGLAASFGVVGLGSDTWGSIRNPASNNALVGLRPSWALVSRAGMVGLYDARDTAGPMARTVADLAALLDVIAGVDEDDPATAEAAGKIPPTYKVFLNKAGASGKRLGVLRQAFPPDASDPNVVALLDRAIADLRRCGAEIVDPFLVPEFGAFPAQAHPASEVRAALERYLKGTAPEFPKSLAALIATEKFHPLHEAGLRATAAAPPPRDDPIVHKLEADEVRMRRAYLAAMDRDRIDALILPVAAFPPKLNGDRNTTPTGATTWIASGLHWPAAVVPMGYTYEDLPSGLQIIGRPWTEPLLIEIAYAYEQSTRHRKRPATAPELHGAMPTAEYRINDPAIVQEIERAFAGYNQALGANDVDALNRYFFDSPSTVRYGNGENLYGFAEIKAYRASVVATGVTPRRERTVITAFGRDFATVATLTRGLRPGKIGRTMQSWVRFPQGWRIVAAHVSTIDDAP
jgi:Asp-tRNA(Asn)/Glu-tRNA(Gln) amidotransferase A subunit family amidase